MDNPVGYLYRVAVRRALPRRKRRVLHEVPVHESPWVEPALASSLAELSPNQRACVWLVHGCGWSQAEAAEALELSTTAVNTHVNRAIARLRDALEVDHVS